MPKQIAAKISDVEHKLIRQLIRAGLFINSSYFVRDAVRRRLGDFGVVSKTGTAKLKENFTAT